MSTFTPFGACVEHLCLSHADVADMLSEGTGKPYSLHRAKMVCEGPGASARLRMVCPSEFGSKFGRLQRPNAQALQKERYEPFHYFAG
jgi:hypothetical protein